MVNPTIKSRLFPYHQVRALQSSDNPDRRWIIIGDVHGCIRELEDLLHKVNPGKKDRVLFLGDLVNRGPHSRKVVRLARGLEALSLMGNHELRLLKYRYSQNSAHLNTDDRKTVETLEEEDWAYLSSMALTLHWPRNNCLFVHGGFLPAIPWREQDASIVTSIRNICHGGMPCNRKDCPMGTFWAKKWDQKPFVVYGHTPQPSVVRKERSLGIDTGCVWGGKLTAFILPEKRLVQVDAREKYIP